MPQKTHTPPYPAKEDGFWTKLTWRLAMTPRKHAILLIIISILLTAAAAILYKTALTTVNTPAAAATAIALFTGVLGLVTAVMMLFMQKIRNDIRKELEKGREKRN